MNKIISFSLWGNNPKYTIGAIRNAELAQSIYPEWGCYFFLGSSVSKDIQEKLLSIPNVSIFLKDNYSDWRSMFWRFETSYCSEVDISIFRDTDSRINLREKYAVEEWVASDKTFNIMRDHPFHNYAILGGMWGYKKNHKYDMQSLLGSFDKVNEYGTDYNFFTQVLYPLIGDDKSVHDPFFDKKPFPTQRKNKEFVGDIFDQFDKRDDNFHKYIPL